LDALDRTATPLDAVVAAAPMATHCANGSIAVCQCPETAFDDRLS